jgi:ATP-dependent Lhr-like helicase
VAAWFRANYGEPTPVQEQGWPEIAAGRSTLLCAPTGSGKTLAAFLAAIDRERRAPAPGPGVRVLYVSPLRALGNDVRRNLEIPLAALGGVRAAVRTGDTPPAERRRQLRHPPQILITTPESAFLLLGTEAGRAALRTVRTVIVDEIHALAPNRRGAHLALTLERLEDLAGGGLQRVGLSATQRPLGEVAAWLTGGRPACIVDAGAPRALDLRVLAPVADFGDVPGDSVWDCIVPQVLDLIRRHRTTLVFVSNRGLCERLAMRLNAAAGESICRSHHGSTARELRQAVEADLKAGRLRAVCATGTLELGIDVGSVDLVVQVEAPGGVARGLQRVGRAGHQVGATPRGRIIAKHPGDLLEAAVTAAAMRDGEIEPTRVPRAPLDVLAQQAVAAAAAMGAVAEEDLFALCRRAYPYRDLSRAEFEAALRLVSDAAVGVPRVDRADGQLRARAGVRSLVARSGGTIPDRGLYPAFFEGRRVGELDEEFVYESRVGDTFLLGSSSWRIEAIRAEGVLVSPGRGGMNRVPFWHGDGLGRPAELGARIGAFLREAEGRRDLRAWLTERYLCDERAAEALAGYLARQPVLPTDRRVVVESFADPLGEGLTVIHSVFGARVNAPWAIALGAALGTQAVYTQDGILLRTGRLPRRYGFPELRARLEGALPRTPLFAALFRENAARALVLPRLGPGRRTPLWLQRLRAGDLLADALRDPAHPLVRETMRQCLEDVFDLGAWERAMACETVTLASASPTPFARGMLMQFQAKFLYEGDAPSAERLQADVAVGGVDPAALREAVSRPRAETPEALLDLLRRTGGLREDEIAARSAVPAEALGDRVRRDGALWVVADEGPPGPDRVARFLRTTVPVTAAEVARRFGLADARPILDQLVAAGRAVPVEGRFAAPEVLRAAHRRVLARLRAELAPRTRGELAAWIAGRLDLERLQGYPLSRRCWEEEMLPGVRLDAALATGAYVAVGGRPAFYRRELVERLLPPLPAQGPVVEALRSRGALFFSDVCRFSGLPPEAALAELRSLLAAGVVSNDSLAPWRLPVHASPGRAGAALGGRWFLVPRGEPDPSAWVDVMLLRYGVLARGLWEREAPPVPWTEALAALRARERQGALLRGYFVRGLGGLQFASRATVEELRAAVPPAWWWLPAASPANLLSGRRERAFLVMRGANAVLSVAGGRVSMLVDLSEDERLAAAAVLAELPGSRGRLMLDWPAGEAALAAAGFSRRPRGWVRHRAI